jgi:hypothetical protein
MKNTIVALIIAALLTACGGNDSSSTNQPVIAQSKQLQHSDKAVASDYQTLVQELYVSYFGRPADPTGLVNLENALLAANAPTDIQSLSAAYATNPAIQSLINSFGASAESIALYGSGNPTAFVTAIFQNVLGRTPQQSGLTYWAGAITSGQLSQGDTALAIMAGALANTTAQGMLDAELIENRLTVASYFTAQVAGRDIVSAYAGATAAAGARTMLNAVIAATDTVAYETIVNSVVAALGSGGDNTGATTLALLAGNMGGVGNADGAGVAARFNGPGGIATDKAGNIYVADSGNNTIRKITPAGVVTTLAGTPGLKGSADGAGAAASFWHPSSVAADNTGNIYVADTWNNTIRKITPAGVVTTLAGTAGANGSADGAGAAANFSDPCGVATDSSGNIYVADTGNSTIRKITPAGIVTTLAGTSVFAGGVPLGNADGTGAAAGFNQPNGVATDSVGNVYVADTLNNTIRKVTPAGVVTTLAGTAGTIGGANGEGSAAAFNQPSGVATDSAGNIYVADTGNATIRKITPAGMVTTLAGTTDVIGGANGAGAASGFNQPNGVATDGAGNVYVADTGNATIRKITPAGMVATLAGTAIITGSADGIGISASFFYPQGIAADNAGNVYVADAVNNTIRKITPARVVTTLAGTAGTNGNADGTGAAASFNFVIGVLIGVATDNVGNVYAADTLNNTIRKITPTGVVTTLAGTAGVVGGADGVGAAASFNNPQGIATDGAGNVYVADTYNYVIRKITADGVVTTLAGTAGAYGYADGTGTAAAFNQPNGVAVDSAGNVYVTDYGNDTIRKITPAGVVTTLAGTAGVAGCVDGGGMAVRFNGPQGIAIDGAGNVYVADTNNDIIRKITPIGAVTTLAGIPGQADFVAGALPGGLSMPSGIAIWGPSLYTTAEQGIAVINNLP